MYGGLGAGILDLCLAIEEGSLPVSPGVRGACELLGLDPLYVANEGILLVVVRADMSEYSLEILRKHPRGRGAARVGEVVNSPGGKVLLRTGIGGSRLVEMLEGEQLPRIC